MDTLQHRALHHDPWTPPWTQVTDLTLGIHIAPRGNRRYNAHSDPSLYRAMDPDIVLSSSPGPNVPPWSQVAAKVTTDPHGPSSSVVPGYQSRWRPKVLESVCPQWQQEPWTSTLATYSRATNPDMAPNSSPDSEATMVPSSSMCHSYLYDLGCIMDLGHQYDPSGLLDSRCGIAE